MKSFPKPVKKIKTKKRLSRVRKTPMGTLERKCWTIFSRYIRLRDVRKSGSVGLDWLKCYTCGKAVLFKEAEAGHFIPRGKKVYKFHECNVHAQCTRCNHYLHGNLGVYAIRLDDQYGLGFGKTLVAHQNDYHKFTREELEGIIKNSLEKIKQWEAI